MIEFDGCKTPETDCEHWLDHDTSENTLHGMSDVEADAYLVRLCALHMAAKLALSRAKGRGGWHTPSCSDDYLRRLLREHVEKGDMVDVLNIAGMILVRQESNKQQESLSRDWTTQTIGTVGGTDGA